MWERETECDGVEDRERRETLLCITVSVSSYGWSLTFRVFADHTADRPSHTVAVTKHAPRLLPLCRLFCLPL